MFEFDARYTKIHLFCRLPETSNCNFMTEIINLDLSLQFMSPSLSDQIFLFTFVSTLNTAFSVAVDFNERSFGGDEVEEPPRLQTSVHSAAQTALKSWTALPSLAQIGFGNMALPGLVSHSSGLAEDGYISVKVNLFN